ncbi:MAG: patatin-like phospholipase family protein [Micropruina sp.]|uniref:patatin-like phospholipase family protein n=1 Tax=Micropruina sp. TaxID=2737536 RepID=UPI0039E570D1
MKVNLVLGAGGARGFAHVGVIQELHARGHDVVGVAGTSMGALVGGVLAAGGLDGFTDWVRTLTRGDIVRLTDFTFGAPGLIRLQRVMRELHRFIGNVRIEELPIPYTAVATDIDAEREVWFRKGPLVAAIRASIAIPAVFTPVRIGDRLLVDGGLLNPLPLAPTMDMPGEVNVGVSLFGKRSGLHVQLPSKESSDAARADNAMIAADAGQPSWTARLGQSVAESWPARNLGKLLAAQPPAAKDFEDWPTDVNLVDLLGRTLDVMQGRIEIARTVLNVPDVLVWVPMDSCAILDFHRAEEMIELGRRRAVKEFDRMGL